MKWIDIGIEIGLICLICAAWLKNRCKTKEQGILRFLMPIGNTIAGILQPTRRKRERNSMFQLLCQLTTEEEGERLYQSYRCKRWAILIGILVFCNGVWIIQQAITAAPKVLTLTHERPDYGNGNQKEQVELILGGSGEAVTGIIEIVIPQKEISREMAESKLKEGQEYLMDWAGAQNVYQDMTFPSGWNGVSFFYRSHTPDLMKNNGQFVGEVTEEKKEISLGVTASIGEFSQEFTIAMAVPAAAELTAEQRLEIISKEVKKGNYISAEALTLPEKTKWGEELAWQTPQKSSWTLWLFLFVVLPLTVLWKQDNEYKVIFKEKQKQMRSSYPEFINELVILIGAGMSLTAAWKRIGGDYQKQKEITGKSNLLYEEVCRGGNELDNGGSMREVLENFTMRVRLREVRKFAVLLIQNLKRGDAFLISHLKELNQEAWELRKKQVREKTEEADTKLLLPLMLMLVVVLIIVLAPAMLSMQV